MHVVCGAGVWLPSRAYMRRPLLVCIVCGAGVWLPSPAYMRRPIHKGGCFLSPAVSCCHRVSACACPHRHPCGIRTATPPPVGPTPRSGPHRDELPYRGQGEYRVVTHRNPERGRSLCGPEGSSEGSVAANSLGVPGARSRLDPSNKRVLT